MARTSAEQQPTLEADEHGHDWGSDVERVEHGFAPSIDPGNLKPREQREAEARAELGDDANAPLTKDGRPLTDAEEAERYNRLRSYPSVPPVESRGVIVNGIATIVATGQDAEGTVPPEVAEVIENASVPLRTGQAKGLGNGLRTFDLTAPEGDPRRGDGSVTEALKQRAEARRAAAETEPTTPPPPPPPPPSEPAPAPRAPKKD